jgi:hypothetical protein
MCGCRYSTRTWRASFSAPEPRAPTLSTRTQRARTWGTKPYEADMRHLANTYVQADPAADLGSLTESDRRNRHPRCHCKKIERERKALAERHRRASTKVKGSPQVPFSPTLYLMTQPIFAQRSGVRASFDHGCKKLHIYAQVLTND